MAINGSGIRDTAWVLKINKNTIIRTLPHFNPKLTELSANKKRIVPITLRWNTSVDDLASL